MIGSKNSKKIVFGLGLFILVGVVLVFSGCILDNTNINTNNNTNPTDNNIGTSRDINIPDFPNFPDLNSSEVINDDLGDFDANII